MIQLPSQKTRRTRLNVIAGRSISPKDDQEAGPSVERVAENESPSDSEYLSEESDTESECDSDERPYRNLFDDCEPNSNELSEL